MGEVKICRLCFTLIDDKNYEILEGIRTEMIKIVSIPLNPSISEEPVVCSPCSQNLQRCFDFKMTCLNTEDCIKSFTNRQSHVTVDLRDVLLKEISEGFTNREKTQICRLCLNFEGSSYTKLDVDDPVLKEMVKEYVSELNLSLTIDPLICSNCLESLNHEFSFVRSCLETEEKIKKYCEGQGSGFQSKVDLKKVCSTMYSAEVKMEADACEERTDVEFVACQPEGMAFKSEPVKDSTPSTHPPQPGQSVNLLNCTQPSKPKTNSCKECNYQTESKRDLIIHNFSHGKGKKLYECPLCPFITRHRTVITNHELTHKSLDEIDWHQCQVCTYRTKLKANLRNHMQIHKKPEEVKRFKCEACPYRSLWRRDLERHVLKHLEPGQAKMHKCDYCEFTTKHERYLKQHAAKLHLGGGETQDTTYSCATCNFTTKLKRSLVPHMLIHKNPEDLTIYRCSICPYQAKWKESVKKHELIHKNKFKCDECDFQTTLKRYLDKHKIAHRSLEETPTVYNCDLCNYQTVRKNGLQNHMLVHKTAEEVQMHPCPHCTYRTKRLQDLKQHVLVIHTEDITVYSCDQCPYQTKYKYNYRGHKRMMHRSPADVKMHKCDQCDFTTKYKSSLVSHVVSYHKSAEEITMLKCSKCEFETKRRECLRMHQITHKRPDEMEMFKCGDCGFQTKYKRALKKHMQGHRPDVKKTRKYRCVWCIFQTNSKLSMLKHEKRHKEAGDLGGGDERCTIVKHEVKTIKEEVLA